MGAILSHGFVAPGAALKIIAALFVANAAGYFVGEGAHNAVLASFSLPLTINLTF